MSSYCKINLLIILCSFTNILTAQITFIQNDEVQSNALIKKYQLVDVDVDHLNTLLTRSGSPLREMGTSTVSIPFPSGEVLDFVLEEAPLMESELASKYREIKNYRGYCKDRPEVLIRLNTGPKGLYYHVSDPTQGDIILSPHKRDKRTVHYLYRSNDQYSNWSCSFDNQLADVNGEKVKEPNVRSNNCFTNGLQLRTFRVAITTTGEFYNLNGGNMTGALNALTNRLASVALIYERDLAITFQLIADNTDIMFTDPSTDPFTDPTNRSTSINQAETTIEDNIPDADYDIGHGYHEITCGGSCGWGGLAGVAVICNNGDKARAYTYQPNDIPGNNTVWAHEFGHQFGCLHTNYGCGSSGCQRYEPGEGQSIMSTGASCTPDDSYASRIDFFNAGSLDQIIGYVNNGSFTGDASCNQILTSGGTCAITSSTSNTAIPVVDSDPIGINTLIPIGTPFMLTGTASDANGDALTYSWEHYDTDNNNTDIPDNAGNIATAPLFRVFGPSTNPTRYFPQLSSILSGSTSGTGEVLPTVGRTMNMRLIVRDNHPDGGAVACDEVMLTVDGNSGPFLITSQNTSTSWSSGDSETINWSVNNTNNAPINAANVEILFSDDGGESFPYTLVASTPNDGSEIISVPNISTNNGRVMIRPIGSNYIFFDINNIDISISSSCQAIAGEIAPTTQVVEPQGSSNLNLTQSNSLGNVINSFSGNIDGSDAGSNVAFADGSPPSCLASNSNKYELSSLYVDAAGTYTLNLSAPFGQVTTLYSGSFNPSNVCMGWLASSATRPSGTGSVTLNNSVSVNLVPNQEYTIVHNTFSTNTSYYGTYTVNISGPGNVYDGPIAPSGFLYTYIIVDENDNIVEFDQNTDLSDNVAGNYTIYGLNYDGSSLSSYIGNSVSNLENDILNGNICASISSNSRSVTITSTCDINSPLPTATGLYTSTQSFVDGGIRYYCDNEGNMLLGIEDASNIPDDAVTINISTNTATYYTAGTGFVTANPGAAIIPGTWDVTGTITSDAIVRYFLPSNALALVADAIPGTSDDPTSISQFSFYKITNPAKPAHASVPDLQSSDIVIITNGSTSSTSEWVQGTLGTKTYAEFMTASFSGGGGGAGANGEAILPIELISFTGVNRSNVNSLFWQTANEINNDFFLVQRSSDGKNFTTIGKIKGAGNSTIRMDYQFDDRNSPSGISYYRLKQIDYNGNSSYSNIVKLTNTSNENVEIFPNPTSDILNVRFNAVGNLPSYIHIQNAEGKVIIQKKISTLKGHNLISISTESLVPGTYFIKIIKPTISHVMRFLKTK